MASLCVVIVIKEQKMTENLFEIATYNKPLYRNATQPVNSYHTLLQTFCNTSYALYTQYFIKQIALDAQKIRQNVFKFSVKKNLRKCVKKFMLTDLQLIFLAHYCKISQWKYDNKQLMIEAERNMAENEGLVQQKSLQLFLDLNAYFVKYYVGNQQQFQAIDKHIYQIFPKFSQIYKNWVLSKPKQTFNITPRKISQLYREYSRGSQQQTNKKDYNDLIDTLIDLSTTYSIMPYKKTQKKNVNQIPTVQYKDTQYQPKPRNMKNRTSSIFKIAEDEEKMEQSQLPRFNYKAHNKKSSFIFESLQSFSRKSDLPPQVQVHLNKEIIKQNYKQKQKQPSPQRSREKKQPNKISLSFKRKQKPNQTVLGFIKQPSILQLQNEQRNRSESNRSILNNMSFINLRSNRSSKSNSQIPFLWRPSEDNFFQKSKFN